MWIVPTETSANVKPPRPPIPSIPSIPSFNGFFILPLLQGGTTLLGGPLPAAIIRSLHFLSQKPRLTAKFQHLSTYSTGLLRLLISDILRVFQCSHDKEYCFNMLQHCDPSSGHPWLPLSVFSRPCAVIIMGRSTLLSRPEVVATAVPTAVSTAVPTTVPVPKHDQNSVTCRNILKCWKAPMSPKTAMEKLASADCEADTKLHTFGDVINWHQSLWVD